ncbi:MAG: hypothetical protein KBC36_02520 [Spirochaetia bacterium]|nr:hypothetical protein [Spirochaetia bacterium]
MTNAGGRSRTARRASALPSAAAALAAASLAMTCGAGVPAPERRAATAVPAGAVFPLSRRLRAADASFEPFPLVSDARLRAVAATGGGILAWSHGDDTLRLYRTDGGVAASWPLEAAAAWVSPTLALTRGELYAEDGGFDFALHELELGGGPRKLASWKLDCFPSELAFSGDGVLLAGADLADRAHVLRELRPDGTARLLFEFPKRDDFARFVDDGGRFVVFASARTRGERELAAYLVEANGASVPDPAEARLELRGLPEGALCWYGSGFSFEERFWLPLAMSDGDTALAGFRLEGEALELEALVRASRGVYAPLGPSADAAVFLYLAYDHETEPGVWRLASFDGEAIAFDVLGAP